MGMTDALSCEANIELCVLFGLHLVALFVCDGFEQPWEMDPGTFRTHSGFCLRHLPNSCLSSSFCLVSLPELQL